MTPAAFDTGHNGYWDAFVAKLDASGSTLIYSTFLGSGTDDTGRGIACDGEGNAYVTGWTGHGGFPTTPGAFDTTHNGGYDIFGTQLSASGSTLRYSTFLGGGDNDYGYDITLDSEGHAYLVGQTLSTDFPTTSGSFDPEHNGFIDALVTKLLMEDSAPSGPLYLPVVRR